MAPTGRAAAVMRRKGCADATTIDRAIYEHPFEWECASDGCKPPCRDVCVHARQRWLGKRLNPDALAGIDLIILDEASMVGPEAAHDLLSLGKPILAVGDPGQLPPVFGPGFFTGSEPDALLTQIHRQAAGNPIIELATEARRGEYLAPGAYGDSYVTRGFDGRLADFDAVICGRNLTRQRLNKKIRRELGFAGPFPMIGERLLVLRNRHEKRLSNGDLVTVADVAYERLRDGFLPIVVATDDGRRVEIRAPVDLLINDDTNQGGSMGDPVVWGYAITGHKAQGSQWGDILVVDESPCFREHKNNWLYTAITRAAERVTIVKGMI
jgi:exodeoxyribonuclease-5